MNCETSNELIMRYFDGEINDIEEAQLMQHLKACKTCNEEFRCMKEAFTALEAVSEIEPPEDFEVKVMDKINALVYSQKQSYSHMLVLLYNAASIVSIALLLFFVADIKQVDILGIAGRMQEYFGSFSNAASAVLGVVKDLFGLVASICNSLFVICFTIVKAYYYVILTMLAVLVVIQRLLVVFAVQDGRKAG